MKFDITTLEGGASGSLDLSDEVFGLEPRVDILQRVVRWQLAKRRAGTHDVKNRAEIARTGKKLYRQKGSGKARHSSARAPQFRGGGRSFGPTPRDHTHALPKKVRALGLKFALSAKVRSSSLIILDRASMKDAKTAALLDNFGKLGLSNALIIDGAVVDQNFGMAARNIPYIDVLPVQGINVYDIMRRDKLVLTRAAVDALEARLK